MQKQTSPAFINISTAALLLATFLLSGCGEFAYKRGASASDLQEARKACATQGDSPVIAEQCLADKGWTVKPLDKMDPLLATVGISDNRTGKLIQKGGSTPETNAELAKPADPLDSFKISSWWKTGADANALKSGINECVATLGEAHRPAPGSLNATRGLLLCMRTKGWYALAAQ
ncbi:hypothetical protein [Methyloradius palustris]|uniref:Lipoprotein n=1 Tax=Methyloradius palustris TaxID=2778876 RepID=A0A8D5GAI6_9PROT|nr:hypothetical protein [Methyloradius palustris]BCM26031.1 hypothetical protein ZMTM_22900 [Methyloradius palustris]